MDSSLLIMLLLFFHLNYKIFLQYEYLQYFIFGRHIWHSIKLDIFTKLKISSQEATCFINDKSVHLYQFNNN